MIPLRRLTSMRSGVRNSLSVVCVQRAGMNCSGFCRRTLVMFLQVSVCTTKPLPEVMWPTMASPGTGPQQRPQVMTSPSPVRTATGPSCSTGTAWKSGLSAASRRCATA